MKLLLTGRRQPPDQRGCKVTFLQRTNAVPVRVGAVRVGAVGIVVLLLTDGI